MATRNNYRGALQEWLFHALMIAAAALLAWLSLRHAWYWDWTQNQRNSLSSESVALLERLESPLRMTSFAPDNGPLRGRILRLLERYRRASPEYVEIVFVDPELRPDLARLSSVELAGELVVEYLGRRERLQTLSEGHISNALQRLLGRPENWIGALSGHGERSFTGHANHDLGDFGAELEKRGYRLQAIDLSEIPVIPDNVGLLIVPGPRVDLLGGEVHQLRDYVNRGGNLLWLMDPDDLHALAPLSEELDVEVLPGRIVDPNVAELGVDDPTVALVSRYPDHPVTEGFDLITLYPGAAALRDKGSGQWRPTSLLSTLPRSWNETGPVKGQIDRDPLQGEIGGPLAIGIALERPLATPTGAREQRVAVIGDGDFLANAFLSNAGNRELGLRLIRWLLSEDQLLEIPSREAADRELRITRALSLWLGAGSLLVAPLVFLAAGLGIRWYRRRA